MSKHTPGDWTAQGCAVYVLNAQGYNRFWLLVNPGQIGERDEKNREKRTPDCELEADARLIAAAPDLLEACRYMLTLLTDMGHGGTAGAILGRAAIARAEGGS